MPAPRPRPIPGWTSASPPDCGGPAAPLPAAARRSRIAPRRAFRSACTPPGVPVGAADSWFEFSFSGPLRPDFASAVVVLSQLHLFADRRTASNGLQYGPMQAVTMLDSLRRLTVETRQTP